MREKKTTQVSLRLPEHGLEHIRRLQIDVLHVMDLTARRQSATSRQSRSAVFWSGCRVGLGPDAGGRRTPAADAGDAARMALASGDLDRRHFARAPIAYLHAKEHRLPHHTRPPPSPETPHARR